MHRYITSLYSTHYITDGGKVNTFWKEETLRLQFIMSEQQDMNIFWQLKYNGKQSMCVYGCMCVYIYNVCVCVVVTVWSVLHKTFLKTLVVLLVSVHLWTLTPANDLRMYLPLTTLTVVDLCHVCKLLPVYYTVSQGFHSLVSTFKGFFLGNEFFFSDLDTPC